MLMLVQSLAGLFNLIAFVAAVVILIQLFNKKGVGMGILGIICGLYTFIWGWQNAGALDAEGKKAGLPYRTWMMIWTAAFLLGLGLQFLSGFLAAGAAAASIKAAADAAVAQASAEAAAAAASANAAGAAAPAGAAGAKP